MKKNFLCKVCYSKQTGEDNPGIVTETYLVGAETPSAAEKAVLEEIGPYVFGECEVLSISKRNFFEIIRPENRGENFYEAKVEMITIDGESETRKNVGILIQANMLDDAVYTLKQHMSGYNCEMTLVKKSAIVDVLEYETAEETK